MNFLSASRSAPAGPAFAPDLVSFRVHAPTVSSAEARRLIRIEAAHSGHQRNAANALLNERYGWRGYGPVSLPAQGAGHSLPLTASRDGTIIGTLTVNFDDAGVLNCDDTFPEELAALRECGARLCEFSKLAIDTDEASPQVLAALFHVAFLAASQLEQVDTILLEVNPRHVRYYQRMLGARMLASSRLNRRVSAPAVLLAIAASDIRQWIDKHADAQESAGEEAADGAITFTAANRTLYGRAFNRVEEAAIVTRLSRHWPRIGGQRQARPFAFRLPAAPEAPALVN